jgi:DNA topoisomerase IA
MKLFIAEKPSLARAIAEGIGVTKKGFVFFLCCV